MNSDVLLLICLGLLALFALISAYWWRQVRALQNQIRQMQAQQQHVTDTAVSVGRKLVQLQKDLQGIASKIQGDAMLTGEYKAYNQAATLLQQGARLEEVIEKCHLTRGEAELLASMHRAAQGERPN